MKLKVLLSFLHNFSFFLVFFILSFLFFYFFSLFIFLLDFPTSCGFLIFAVFFTLSLPKLCLYLFTHIYFSVIFSFLFFIYFYPHSCLLSPDSLHLYSLVVFRLAGCHSTSVEHLFGWYTGQKEHTLKNYPA